MTETLVSCFILVVINGAGVVGKLLLLSNCHQLSALAKPAHHSLQSNLFTRINDKHRWWWWWRWRRQRQQPRTDCVYKYQINMQIFGNVKIKRRQWERDRDRRLALDASPSHCARYGTQFEHTLDYNASTRTIFYYQIENVIFGCLRSLAAGVVYCERVSDVTSADFNVDEYINEFGEKIGNHRTACMSYPRCLCSMRALLTARKQIIIINKLYAFSDEWVLWHIPWSMSGLTKPKLHITSFHSWRKMKCIAGTPPAPTPKNSINIYHTNAKWRTHFRMNHTIITRIFCIIM